MHRPDVQKGANDSPVYGLTHFALSLGSKSLVDSLTKRLRADGFTILGEPRATGDGYYESVILDLGGNQIELTECGLEGVLFVDTLLPLKPLFMKCIH